MSASEWAAIAFGTTLAVVVGLRLSHNGLIVVGLVVILFSLLWGRLFSEWLAQRLSESVPEVWVERQKREGLGGEIRRHLALPWPLREPRRGGWPHLSEAIKRMSHPPSGS